MGKHGKTRFFTFAIVSFMMVLWAGTCGPRDARAQVPPKQVGQDATAENSKAGAVSDEKAAPGQMPEGMVPSGQGRLEKVLDGLERRYSSPSFAAEFNQESTLKAMDITDTASGTVMVKRPGMMRWEYATPEPQTIVTDGDSLWIYRPEDNQVMLGKAPAFFKDGKGAGFLSDIKLLREKFDISMEEGYANRDIADKDSDYRLKLEPRDPSLELAAIFIAVDSETFLVKNIVTLNPYEDETRIRMGNYNFDVTLEDDLFHFKIPQGVDILELE